MSDQLEIRVMDPPARGRTARPVVVLMHGRGADPSDLAASGPGSRTVRPWSSRAPLSPRPTGATARGGPGTATRATTGRRSRPSAPPSGAGRAAGGAARDWDTARPRRGRRLLPGRDHGPRPGTPPPGRGCRRVLNFSGFLPSHPDVPVTPESVRGHPLLLGPRHRRPGHPLRPGRARPAARSSTPAPTWRPATTPWATPSPRRDGGRRRWLERDVA
jgi:hypothetical protein